METCTPPGRGSTLVLACSPKSCWMEVVSGRVTIPGWHVHLPPLWLYFGWVPVHLNLIGGFFSRYSSFLSYEKSTHAITFWIAEGIYFIRIWSNFGYCLRILPFLSTQAPLVQRCSAVHWLNHYLVDNDCYWNEVRYLVDGDVSSGYCYPPFEQLGPSV